MFSDAPEARAPPTMAEGMVLASLRAETAQLVAEKDADIARLKYDLAVERGEREKLATLGEQLGRANAALEGSSSLVSCCAWSARRRRVCPRRWRRRAFRDRVDTMRHEMQGVVIAFNQLSRATTALMGKSRVFRGDEQQRRVGL